MGLVQISAGYVGLSDYAYGECPPGSFCFLFFFLGGGGGVHGDRMLPEHRHF